MREYDAYTVAYTDMQPSPSAASSSAAAGGAQEPVVLGSPAMTGGAFNTLAAYLFGACVVC